MNRKLFFILLMTISFGACQSDQATTIICEQVNIKDNLFTFHKTLGVSIDSFPQVFLHERIFYDNQLKRYLLVVYDPYQHALARYDLDTATKFEAIRLKKEGPNKISEAFEDFFYVNEDSILFLTDDPRTPLKLLENGAVNPLSLPVSEEFVPVADSDYNFRLAYNKSKHTVSCYAYPITFNDENKRFFKHPLIVQFSLKDQKLTKKFGSYPYPHLDKPLGYDYIPSVIYLGDSTIISFGALDYLIVYEDGSDHPNQYCAQSESISVNLNGFKRDFDRQRFRNFFNQSAFYLNFYYDPHRELFYRLIKHPQDLKNAEGKLNSFYHAEWSVLVFNKKLQKIGEQVFPGLVYDPYDIVFSPAGIYLKNRKKQTDDTIYWDFFEVQSF